MANTLTGLIPTIRAGLNEVSRELIGFIPNTNVDAKASMAAKGQVVRSPVAPKAVLEDITPGQNPAVSGSQTMTYKDVTITKSRAAPILWNGEEQLSLTQDGQASTILADQFAEAFRAIANEVEADIAAEYISASRAYGTAGTTPFGTSDNHTDFAGANRVLDENGAPQSGRVLIVGSAARANLEGKQASLFKLNEAGDGGAMLRNRQQGRLHGFDLGFSAQVASHTAGTGAGYLVNNAGGYAVGATAITVDTGAGTIVAGDVITIAGDSNKYVVATTLAAGIVTIAAPGLLVAAADNAAVTVGGSSTENMFYHRNSIVLAARQPAMPDGGDEAQSVTSMFDPVSGLTFQIAHYKQYRQTKFEVGLAWGVASVNQHSGILLG